MYQETPASIRIFAKKQIYLLVLSTLFLFLCLLALITDFFLDRPTFSFRDIQGYLISIIILAVLSVFFHSSMGRLTLDDKELIVKKGFKTYTYDMVSLQFRAERHQDFLRGGKPIAIYIRGNLVLPGTAGEVKEIRLLASDRNYDKFVDFYIEHLKSKGAVLY